jgi:hypothetical protein
MLIIFYLYYFIIINSRSISYCGSSSSIYYCSSCGFSPLNVYFVQHIKIKNWIAVPSEDVTAVIMQLLFWFVSLYIHVHLQSEIWNYTYACILLL